ncbi:MAG: endonuclease/exonuclease/phosphatase family protein [Hyphomicrobiaceae bacterium]
MSVTLRLLSYNLWEGMRPAGVEGDVSVEIDRRRADAVQAVVAGLAPDVLVLNEALFCRPFAGTVVDYARLFSYPYEVGALYDGAWGNAILSRHPILDSHEMRIDDRGGLAAVIDTPAGRLTVATYHPHPQRRPAHKAQDFVRLVQGVAGPLILCGDFNCISPEDDIDERRLVESFRGFSNEAEAAVRRFIESGEAVFRELARLGLKDAVPERGRRYSIPTDLINSDKSSGIRIDHILANDWITTLGGEVVHSAATNCASDHHPVMIDFAINSGVVS